MKGEPQQQVHDLGMGLPGTLRLCWSLNQYKGAGTASGAQSGDSGDGGCHADCVLAGLVDSPGQAGAVSQGGLDVWALWLGTYSRLSI